MKKHLAAFMLLSAIHALHSLALGQEAPEKPLWQAASDGDVEAVEAHIAAETNLDDKHSTGYAPLHYAVMKTWPEVVALLLEAGADPDVTNSQAKTPLDLAISGSKEEIIDLLLEAGALVEAPADSLHALAWSNDVLGVKLHIYAGTDIDMMDEFGNIPLLLAVEQGHIGVAELLIQHEASLEVGDEHGFTPLIMSAELNHPELLLILLDAGADIEAEDKAERTALDWAIIMQSTEAEEILRENDAPSGAEKSFIAAIQTNNIDAVNTLLEAGADVNEPAYTTKTPLHYASHSRNKDILNLLLSKGADLEAKTEQGFTPLSYAVGLNRPDNCRILLEVGAEVDSIDNWKRTNLNVAAGQGLAEVAAVLLEFDANPNVLDLWHWSPLDVAEAFGFADIGEMIIEAGGVNGPKMSIHDAATLGDNDMVALHLFFGTDLNQLSDTGETPLDAAANTRKHDTVAFLQAQTRVEFATDEDGQRIFRVVGSYGTGDLAPLLEFTIETSMNLSDWETVESIDTEDGVGVMEFEVDRATPARFFRVAVDELEE
ncbi:MAG: ankyrin repeat domain-containing protein [Verrucomicrobiota bacterium]|nr:ankyrin repeat domain-containing protein [Verrucomicrobiota bacterium]MDP7048706.1 ankyrin repeat domain-containing protein [Verrucomicrobiota bacterium]